MNIRLNCDALPLNANSLSPNLLSINKTSQKFSKRFRPKVDGHSVQTMTWRKGQFRLSNFCDDIHYAKLVIQGVA